MYGVPLGYDKDRNQYWYFSTYKSKLFMREKPKSANDTVHWYILDTYEDIFNLKNS